MRSDFEDIMKECQEKVGQGASGADIVLYLHRQGATIVESMKVLKEVYKLPLGEAKALVTAHPVWADEIKSADILHEELENALRQEDEPTSKK